MGFFKGLELELSNLAGMLSGQDKKKMPMSKMNNVIAEPEKLPVIDNIQKKNISPRVLLPQVQNSIKYFNNLSMDEKMDILENADQKLQDKLLEFMDYNAKFSDNTELTAALLRNIISCAEMIAQRNSYTEKELAYMLREFQRFAAKANIEAERLMNAFLSYRSGCDEENLKISSDNKDQYAIGKGATFKQSVNLGMKIIGEKLQMLQKAEASEKETVMSEIRELLTKLQIELDDFQGVATELLNAFIPEAVSEENKFYARTRKYAEKGIDLDLYIENKVVENILIDTVLESAGEAVANAA